jgi:purine-binding chemotaxis protein CheW
MDGKSSSQLSWLLCRAGSHLCALPLAHIVEVMRPLPVEPLVDAPAFLRGLSVIRGAPVAVIDLGHLLGQTKTAPTRLVTVRVGGRVLGLAVAEVIAVRREDEVGLHGPVPLLGQVAHEAVSSIGALDSEALLFLEELRVLAERVPI